ncbi:hypothetical protein KJ815_09505, partial [bacterium]|nr:hypothetical protein [bacterium]
MKSVSLTAFLVVLLAAVSQAQSFQAHIMYFNDGSGQQPIRDLCIGGNPIPDGTVIQIVWDNDGNGPDTDDPRPVLCDYPPTCIGGPSGSVNFNEFLANGGEQNYGEGYFNVTTSWIGVGAIPSPSRYYLRVCLPNLHWVSNVFNINSGVQDIVIGSWTCMEQLCQGENPGFYAELYYYRPTPLYDGCGGITPLPDGTVVQILWDNDLDGPDLGDPRPELCADPPFCYSGPAGTVNFNEFTMNGGVLGLGEGYFYTETGFFSANRLPPLPRYYLRICLPTERWESNVFTLLSGPQEVEITSWTCVPASCSGESLPFQARLIHTVSPLTDECGGGSPLPDGTPIQIFWDTDSDGPDAEDPMPEVCLFPPDCITGPEGTVNYNTFALNGQSLEIGPGKFISEIMFSSVGYLLVPPRFYLRVGTSSLTWESNVFVLHAGVQDAIMSSWTCIDSVFSSCVAPPRPLNLLVSDNRCDGIHLNWSYPDSGVGNDTIAIYRDDVMIALRSALLPDSFVDTQAPVGTFLYGIEARRTCPESSSSSVSPRSWRLGSRLPDPPTAFGVQASDDLCDSVRISWEYSTNIGLDSFLVKRDGVRVGAVGRPSFPGYTVFRHVTTEREPAEYTVVGWSAQCGEGEPSLADSGKAWHEPTGIQQILATDGLCHVTQIQWDNSSLDATAYQVWRANYDGSSPSLMATVPLNETSFLDSTATPWVEYRYWIVATNPCGSGPESVFDLGSRIREPLQVGNVQATDSVSCDSVTVTWNDLSHETGYVILRNGTRLDTVGMDVTVFQDTTAASGVSYAYTVQAFNACGNGPLSQSNAGSVIRLPATVSSFSASDNRCDSIICTWTDLTNEGWYLLYRNGELLDSLPANTVRYADSPPAGTYSFGIVAANSCGLGSLRQDSGRRMAPLGLVTGIVASDDSCELVRIVWNNNISGEDSFQVRRDGLRIGVTPPNVTALNDTSAGINVRYLYSVVAYNTCGEGAVAAGDSGGRACIPRITVIQPNGGESWFIQDTANIRWNSRYISENVRIEINRSYPSGVWETIAENTDDNGSFYWPVAGPTTSSARIRVTGVASSFVGDTSNANFSIGRRSLAVSVPNGGETWIIGDTYAITWTSANLPGNVRIELNRGYPAGEWETVSASTPNDGSQLWVVSEPVAGVARVRIVGVSYPWIGDTTDADFSIARRSLTLVQPVGGESCAMGIPYDIMWTSENLTGTIRIELNRAFPEGTWATLTANAPNTGLYTWTPSYPATDRARIRVKSVNFPLLADTSDADFFIPSPLPEQLPGTASNPVPVDGETFVSSTPRLSWYPAPRAERYNVFLWPDTLPEPTSPIAANLTEISYQVGTSLQYGRMYNWRIVSTNLYGEAPGPVWSFRVRTLPNLTVSQVQVPPEAYSGQPYQVSWIVTNTGSAATSSPVWYDRLYLSPQPEYNGQLVTYLGQYENVSFLPSGASYTNSATFTLPQGITGDYYVFARTDFSGHVQESSENDNLGRNDDPMHVNLTPPPDLQVTNIISPANAFSGQSVSMTWTVQNRGTGPTIVGTWSDAVYLSRDTLLSGDDHALGATQHVGILLPDSSYQGSRIVTLPQTIYGAFYFLVQTDIGNSVYEFVFEQNNTEYSDTLTVTLTPPPDLIVSDLVVPTSGTAGQPLSIQWTVLNNGPGTPFENSWNDRVYASLDTALNLATATVLGSYSRTGALPPDSSYTRAATANLPSSLFGSVFIYVKTDYNNQVFEHTSEDNNVRRSSLPVEVSAAPWPDLVVTSVTAPSTAGSGQNVSVEWTVQNQGPGSVPQTTWND